MANIYITGSSGFVGQALVGRLSKLPNISLSIGLRDKKVSPSSNLRYYQFDLNDKITSTSMPEFVDIVIHLAAALPHQHRTPDYLKRVNANATAELYKLAASKGAQQFIFMSTAGVHGNSSGGTPITETSKLCPKTEYAQSKLKAEMALQHLFIQNGLHYTIIRPPLVYGPNSIGSFATFKKLVQLGVPLPFKSLQSPRSLIALDLLVDFIELCIENPACYDEIFLMSDPQVLSTNDLVHKLANSLNTRTATFRLPRFLLKAFTHILRRPDLYDNLVNEFILDSSKAYRVFTQGKHEIIFDRYDKDYSI